jgi:DnaJ-domain-containing protein 1
LLEQRLEGAAMSITRRLVDLAKANLNALLDKANGETGLDQLTDEELEAELQRRRERRRREDEERKAAARAAENARQRTASKKGPAPPPPRREEKKKAPPPPASGPPIGDKRLRELYAQLEVPYGAGFEEVKKSFRRLMRKYHPDLHAGNPQKQKTATQLTMSLTQAYNELEQHLTGGRRS